MRARLRSGTRLFCALCGLILTADGAFAQQQPPKPANATAAYLGPPADWTGVSFVVAQASPMFGGREYYVSGSGRIVIVDIGRSRDANVVERRFEVTNAGEATKLIQNLGQLDLLNIPVERNDLPAPTCANPPIFILRNNKGQIRSLPLLRGAPTKAFDDVLLAVASLMRLTRETQPVYEGNYDPKYVPKNYNWTRPILGPGKEIRWAPMATEQQNQKAEEAYLEKVQIQLQEIERVRSGGMEAEPAPKPSNGNNQGEKDGNKKDQNPAGDGQGKKQG